MSLLGLRKGYDGSMWLLSDENKTQTLLDLAEKDIFMGSVLNALKAYGYNIEYRFFAGNGSYAPFGLSVSEFDQEAFKAEFKEQMDAGLYKAAFEFSPRYLKSTTMLTWLHELVHFYQDMHGLFFTPLRIEGQPRFILDEDSAVWIVQACEMMAAIESLRAGWRLKQEQHMPEIWSGAQYSLNWMGFASLYESEILKTTVDDSAACEKIAHKWLHSVQQKYNASRTRKAHRTMLRYLDDRFEPIEVSVDYESFYKLIPEQHKDRFMYLDVLKNHWQNIPQNLDIFIHGSPIFYWAQNHNNFL